MKIFFFKSGLKVRKKTDYSGNNDCICSYFVTNDLDIFSGFDILELWGKKSCKDSNLESPDS